MCSAGGSQTDQKDQLMYLFFILQMAAVCFYKRDFLTNDHQYKNKNTEVPYLNINKIYLHRFSLRML